MMEQVDTVGGSMGLARRKVKKIGWGPGSHLQDERCSCRRPTNGCSCIRLLLTCCRLFLQPYRYRGRHLPTTLPLMAEWKIKVATCSKAVADQVAKDIVLDRVVDTWRRHRQRPKARDVASPTTQ
jgi:hypothetical protein